MMLVALMGLALAGAGELPEWTFDADTEGWIPNGHLANVFVRDGKLRAEAVDWDPFFTCSGLNIEDELAKSTWAVRRSVEAVLQWYARHAGNVP